MMMLSCGRAPSSSGPGISRARVLDTRMEGSSSSSYGACPEEAPAIAHARDDVDIVAPRSRRWAPTMGAAGLALVVLAALVTRRSGTVSRRGDVRASSLWWKKTSYSANGTHSWAWCAPHCSDDDGASYSTSASRSDDDDASSSKAKASNHDDDDAANAATATGQSSDDDDDASSGRSRTSSGDDDDAKSGKRSPSDDDSSKSATRAADDDDASSGKSKTTSRDDDASKSEERSSSDDDSSKSAARASDDADAASASADDDDSTASLFNIIFVIGDDMGFNDVSWNNIDSLTNQVRALKLGRRPIARSRALLPPL